MKDDSLGGAWADDDFDPSSISVPLMNNRPQHHPYESYHHSTPHGGPHSRGGPPLSGDHGRGPPPSFNNRPAGPPYIVKLTNIPSYFGNDHIIELFESRFTKYVKFKLFWDVDYGALDHVQNPSDALNKRKKVAFVELQTSQEFDKVLKWVDIYIENGLGKLLVDPADFEDFKMFNELNGGLSKTDDPSLSMAQKRALRGPQGPPPALLHRNPVPSHRPGPQLLNHNGPSNTAFPPIGNSQPKPHPIPPLHPPSPAPPPKKSNPFGNARPVDTLTKELELEKKLQALEINHTTYRTLGKLDAELKSDESKDKSGKTPSQKSTPHSTASSSKTSESNSTDTANKNPGLRPAEIPTVTAWATVSAGSSSSPATGSTQKEHPLGLHSESGAQSPASYGSKKLQAQKKIVLKRKHIDSKKTRVSPEPPAVNSSAPATETPSEPPMSLDQTIEDAQVEDSAPEPNATDVKKPARPPRKELTPEELEKLRLKKEKKREKVLARRERVKQEKREKLEELKSESVSTTNQNPVVVNDAGPKQTDHNPSTTTVARKGKRALTKPFISSDAASEKGGILENDAPAAESTPSAESTPVPVQLKQKGNAKKRDTPSPPTDSEKGIDTDTDSTKGPSRDAESAKPSRLKSRRGGLKPRGGRRGSLSKSLDRSGTPGSTTTDSTTVSPERVTTENADNDSTESSHGGFRGRSRGHGRGRGRGRGGRGRGKLFSNISHTFNHPPTTE
ncbi:CYFA0S03e03422g1_1 [Cyberlindnera fabianii]|uniref:CYFA0S03e03422g1_1 n=1 Tax=Cyberlindnera fabianii TaxID=36022 RepID=A0A061AQL7_CYBFA|nr:CYFA0S03e03422g1_1 [Cyberlindnera fabianii]